MTKKKKARRRVDVYAVLWTDAVLTDDEESKTTRPVPALTYGVILKAEDDHVVIAGEEFADGEHRLRTSVPAGMSVRVIRVGSFLEPVEFEKWRGKDA